MESRRVAASAARLQRLADELDDDGVGFVIDHPSRSFILEELDYALRPPVHERRIPSYGSIIAPIADLDAWTATTTLVAERRPTVEFGDAEIRRFADGISSWAIRDGGGVDELVVFNRSAGSERDLVILAAASEGMIVQRHPSGVVRVVGRHGVLRHDLTGWQHEPPLEVLLDGVPGCQADGRFTVLGRLIDFAVHDLGSRGIGSLLIFHPTGVLSDIHERRMPNPPALRLDRPHDLAPLRHALGQTDGATVFDFTGTLRQMGVRLVPTHDAEEAVRPVGGTRHTSARRYSYDDPEAVVVAVSDDGPVTVFRKGELVVRSVEQRSALGKAVDLGDE